MLRRLVNDGEAGVPDRRDRGGDTLLHQLRHRAGLGRLEMILGPGREEGRLLSERAGEVVPNCGDQVRYCEAGRQESRKLVEVLNFVFTLAQRFGLAA